eukprot:NODE_7_length_48057_cov_0.322240.p22 type:complete len:184 gc:universal NODE_7_length_48057_cov_0.322240:13374-12823(-)
MNSNATSPHSNQTSPDPSEDHNMVARVVALAEIPEKEIKEPQKQEQSDNPLNSELARDNALGISFDDTQTPIKSNQNTLHQLRYKILMQILNAFGNKFTGSESIGINEWLHQLEFLLKPHNLSSAEKAYVLGNSVRGRAFMVLTEGDSSNYEELKSLLLREFRQPGAYMKSIQDLCSARQGKN